MTLLPCGNPLLQYRSHREEIHRAIESVLLKGRYILGDETEAFEREFSSYLGLSYGIGVGSGTDALSLALRACNITTGDEVITVSHTAVATVAAIEQVGAKPVLVDVEPEYYTIDPVIIPSLITARTKAIIAVHLYGQSADITRLMEIKKRFNLFLIEDCAQCHGAEFEGQKLGSFGDISCFSLYPTKNLGALGDGGFVATDSVEIADRLKLLREYGWKDRYQSMIPGTNSRLDELQSAVLRVKLRNLDRDNGYRIDLAKSYSAFLSSYDFIIPQVRPNCKHVFHLYVIRARKRDQLLAYLQKRAIGALIHYPTPIHLQPAYVSRLVTSTMKETVKASEEVLSLPIFPELSQEDLSKVVETIGEWEKTQKGSCYES